MIAIRRGAFEVKLLAVQQALEWVTEMLGTVPLLNCTDNKALVTALENATASERVGVEILRSLISRSEQSENRVTPVSAGTLRHWQTVQLQRCR